MTSLLLALQAGTFVGLGLAFIVGGEYRLGVAQLLLAGVTALVYGGAR